MEDIHQLRATIKKIKAIWMLIDEITGSRISKQDYTDLISPLFKTAGVVREAQINGMLLQQKRSALLSTYREGLA
jgi:CHAD domain-containing protein